MAGRLSTYVNNRFASYLELIAASVVAVPIHGRSHQAWTESQFSIAMRRRYPAKRPIQTGGWLANLDRSVSLTMRWRQPATGRASRASSRHQKSSRGKWPEGSTAADTGTGQQGLAGCCLARDRVRPV